MPLRLRDRKRVTSRVQMWERISQMLSRRFGKSRTSVIAHSLPVAWSPPLIFGILDTAVARDSIVVAWRCHNCVCLCAMPHWYHLRVSSQVVYLLDFILEGMVYVILFVVVLFFFYSRFVLYVCVCLYVSMCSCLHGRVSECRMFL